jgi:DNA-binding transcriptional LysR family regulator
LRLFDRSGRSPRLTRHGEAVAQAAAGVQGEVEALDELVTRLKEGTETRITVVVDSLFPVESLVGFAKDFAAEHPSVELVLLTELLSAVTAQVRDKHATWGVAVEDADLSGLEQKHIASIRLVPVAAPSHPLAKHRGPIEPDALREALQIVLGERSSGGARQGEDAPRDHGVLSTKTWRVVDLATKHALLLGGLGWGQMPEHVVREDVARKRLVELPIQAFGPEALTRGLVLVWRRGGSFGPVARWAETRLSDLCRKAIGSPRAPRHAT